MDEARRLADGLAETRQQSVEIDDAELRASAITEQFGALDDVRVQAVLARRYWAGGIAYDLPLVA
ncbi:hypothetical protein [Streptomyces ipomoeae]|uniref:hypothetical protein n=1 Tax=Streptomyces ipomoeae TaxID=103232 RepID=UPI0015F11657|nr:hypothetical protein [Streptomyces ipomoeae]MDX2931793.1 hypothetical protein [Streptomyces ipomoeae]